ncbi:unnamed protein product, partial [marine sediment metagenome]
REELEPPEFTDFTSDSAYTGDNFIFSVNVQVGGVGDPNLLGNGVWVDYYYNDGEHTNVSMEWTSGGDYDYVISIPHSLDTLNYSFSANNTDNVWNSTDVVEVTVYDNDNPVLDSDDSDAIGTTGLSLSSTGILCSLPLT